MKDQALIFESDAVSTNCQGYKNTEQEVKTRREFSRERLTRTGINKKSTRTTPRKVS